MENYNEVMILNVQEPVALPDKLKEGTANAKPSAKAGLKKKRLKN